MGKVKIKNISNTVISGTVAKDRFMIPAGKDGFVTLGTLNVLSESIPEKFEIVSDTKNYSTSDYSGDISTGVDSNKVVFLTEDTRHITGGRYYSWWLATALQEAGYEVVVYTNGLPVFIKEFEDYAQPEIRIVADLKSVDVDAKFYVGSPVIGSVMACKLSEKYGKTAFCEIFDPFPMMEKYRGKHDYPGWNELLGLLKKPNVKIISLCKTANKYIYPWLNKKEDEVFEVYPCINSKKKDLSNIKKHKDSVVFISRLDHHKMLNHCLDAVKETKCDFDVITSIDNIKFDSMVAIRKMESRVKMHKFAGDEEKFEIIKKGKVVINGAIFEGFGMWMIEALACGIPVVCYDYETFREIGEGFDNIYFAEWNNPEDLRKKLKQALKEKKFTKGTRKFDFPAMVKRIKEVVAIEPKIGVVQICLNEDKYIGASLRSIIKHKNISKVAVVEGATQLFAHASDKGGLSVDKTRDEVLKVLKEKNGEKIIYERYGWAADKSELRNRSLELLGKNYNYIMVLDADEVWKQDDLDKLVEFVKENPEANIINYPAYHFWKKSNLVAVGSQWDTFLFRFFKYSDKTLHWEHHGASVANEHHILLDTKDKEKIVCDNIHFYHYGALKDEKRIKEKLEFYKKRDTHLKVKNTWSNWKKGKPTQWTHGKGSAVKFRGTHPPEVKKII